MHKMKTAVLIVIALFAGCSTLSEDDLWRRIESAKANQNWDSTLQVSQRILTEYPEGRFGGWARFAAAESYRFKNQPREALDNYKIFVEHYPEMQPASLSLFLVGYLYGNNLQMKDSAKFYLEEFLKRYPNSELVPSVRLELESLGRSPEEVLEQKLMEQKSVSKR